MPETDVTKMKVADLKRELKLRGLCTTGNKNELQDRLQTALIDGELSLEDTAISGEELLDGDDDAVLTDEDEAKILGPDENELLKSPITTHTAAPDMSIGDTKDIACTLQAPTTTPLAAKKVVLKRKSSFTTIGYTTAADCTDRTTSATNISTEPAAVKQPKMSERNPITPSAAVVPGKDNAVTKVSQLSMQERLEMRAKKFGTNAKVPADTIKSNSSDNSITTAISSDNEVVNEQQIEMLKKRAERFGCVVSSKIAKLDAEEKLQKRKQRFGGISNDDTGNNLDNSIWTEKARQRLERFKTESPSPAATSRDN